MDKNLFAFSKLAFPIFIIILLIVHPFMLEAEQIDISVARLAAQDGLSRFYPGEWRFYNSFVYFGLDEKPTAYVFIFSKRGSEYQSLDEITARLLDARTQISSLSGSISRINFRRGLSGKDKADLIVNVEEEIRQIDSESKGKFQYATVLTGAVDSSPTVLKCHIGLPETLVEWPEALSEIKEWLGNDSIRHGRIFYLGPFDFAYETLFEGQVEIKDDFSNTIANKVFNQTTLYNQRSNKFYTLDELKQKHLELASQFEMELDSRQKERFQRSWEKFKIISLQRSTNVFTESDKILSTIKSENSSVTSASSTEVAMTNEEKPIGIKVSKEKKTHIFVQKPVPTTVEKKEN